jgi:hypothetical protein
MDDLISFCVEEIALDGEQGNMFLIMTIYTSNALALVPNVLLHFVSSLFCSGTTLERLWQFVRDFQTQKAPAENVPDGIDDQFKKRFWNYLLLHKEVILKAGDELLHPIAQAADTASRGTSTVDITL